MKSQTELEHFGLDGKGSVIPAKAGMTAVHEKKRNIKSTRKVSKILFLGSLLFPFCRSRKTIGNSMIFAFARIKSQYKCNLYA